MNRNLPDVSQWQPAASSKDNLRNALMTTCRFAQRRIVSRAEAEIHLNLQDFDSGAGVEDIVREELANLLPARYSVDAGVVNDRGGRTAGDCDALIRDPLWSPVIKPGATASSRRHHYPIEGIYAAAEIKQTIGLDELESAMEKMVTVSRLDRAENPYGHITENQHLQYHDRPGLVLNPLHTIVFATRLADGVPFEKVADWFGEINAMLDRSFMVTTLCVLDAGTAWYSVESGSPHEADFMRDRGENLVLQYNDKEPDKSFYRWYVLLASHLTRSVLGLTEVVRCYGSAPPSRTTLHYPEAVFNKR